MMRWMLAILALVAHGWCPAQDRGVDSVWVETYHIWDSLDVNGAPIVTYRVWVTVSPGYSMQVVYGDAVHDLEFSTTTLFLNDPLHSVKYGHLQDPAVLNDGWAALDSWFTLGAASAGHWAVPLHLDKRGGVLRCPPYSKGGRVAGNNKPLCKRDGLQETDSERTVVNWRFEPGYLGDVRGSVIHTSDGAWAVLGGMQPQVDGGHVLIAQLTTSGELSYRFNIQVADKDRVAVKYVHSSPQHGEVTIPSLRRGKDAR